MTAFDKGTTITIPVRARNRKKQLIDPTTIKVTVYDPDGIKKVDAVNMTKDTDYEKGHYYFHWQTARTDAEGKYQVEIEALSGGYTSIIKSPLVILK